MNKVFETVNISSKSVSEDFKVWILVSSDYVLNWLYHAKDDKKESINLNEYWTKTEGFFKMQAVVLDLLYQHDIFNQQQHIVWLDNLFTSARLLNVLRMKDFEDVETVRTTKTKREVIEEKEDSLAQKQKKERNRGLLPFLAELKTTYEAQLNWGALYECVTDVENVLIFAWKNQNVMLFMSMMSNDQNMIERFRRRPAKTATNSASFWAVFDDEKIKSLSIPKFIDFYNHFMNGVDQTDQLRSYYTTQRIHLKHWKSLWHFLLNVIIVNVYKIIYASINQSFPKLSKNGAHKRFRIEFARKLFRRSERLKVFPFDVSSNRSNVQRTLRDLVVRASAEAHESLKKLKNSPSKECEACRDAGRVVTNVKKRKPLGELHPNSLVANKRRNRAPRTLFGCALCKIPLCNHKQCWDRHIEVIYEDGGWIWWGTAILMGCQDILHHLVPADGIHDETRGMPQICRFIDCSRYWPFISTARLAVKTEVESGCISHFGL